MRGFNDTPTDSRVADERLALAFLVGSGWTLLEHRFCAEHHSDIDLIVRRGNVVAFVEVDKMRTTGLAEQPVVELPGESRRKRIEKLASLWALRFGQAGDEYRFDYIGVLFRPNDINARLHHIEHAWAI